jgi:3-oxoadipate enol-lactonase
VADQGVLSGSPDDGYDAPTTWAISYVSRSAAERMDDAPSAVKGDGQGLRPPCRSVYGAQMADCFLERPHARIAYSADGPLEADRTLVAAHGLAASRAFEDALGIFDWSPVARAGERVVRFDRRGHGASTGRPVEEDYRWPVLADDFLAVVEDVSPARPVDGLGESTGCGTLLWAAAKAPTRFRRLVLVIPPAVREARSPQREFYLAGADLLEQRGIEAWRRAAAIFPQPPILAAGGWPRNAPSAVAEELLPAVFRGAAASDLPADEALAALTQESLILAWETDENHPVASARRLLDLVPNARLDVAETPEDIRGWGARIAEFLTSP